MTMVILDTNKALIEADKFISWSLEAVEASILSEKEIKAKSNPGCSFNKDA